MKPETGVESPRRLVWLALVAILAVHVVLAWLIREPGITTRNDDAVYLFLSRALRAFEYRNLYSIDPSQHTQYPPGFPVFLAAISLIAGEHLDLFQAVGTLSSALGLGFVFDVLRRRFSTSLAFLVLVPAALNPWLLRLAGTLIAEPLFLLLSALSVWFLSREVGGSRTAVGTLTALAAALVRSAGIALPVATALWLVSNRLWRKALWVGVASVAVSGPWFVWTMTRPSGAEIEGRSYVTTMRRAASETTGWYLPRRWNVARAYVIDGLPRNLPVPTVDTTRSRAAWGLVSAALVAIGLVPLWRRARLATIYLSCYLGLLLLWPIESPRFLSVVLPFLIAALILGLQLIFRRAPSLAGHAATLGLSGALTLGGAMEWRSDWLALAGCDRQYAVERPGCFHPEVRSYFEAAKRMTDLVPSDGAVLATHEATVAYYSGRKTAAPNPASRVPSGDFLDRLLERGVGHVLLGHTRRFEITWLAPLLLEQCARLDRVLLVPPHAFLFRIRAAGDLHPDRAACDGLAAYLADPPSTAPQRR